MTRISDAIQDHLQGGSKWNDLVMSKEIQKQIISDWQNLVPDMSMRRDGVNVLFNKFVGFLRILLKLEFERGYRIYSANLRARNIMHGTGAFSVSSILLEKYSHCDEYKRVFGYLKEKFLLPINGPISVSMIFDAYKKYGKDYCMLETDDPETPALVATLAGMDGIAKEAADWAEDYFINSCKRNGSTMEQKTRKPYKSVEDWRKQFDAKLANPDALRKQFEDRIVELKLTKVPRYDLIKE
jgi:hypothetical protein